MISIYCRQVTPILEEVAAYFQSFELHSCSSVSFLPYFIHTLIIFIMYFNSVAVLAALAAGLFSQATLASEISNSMYSAHPAV